MTPSISQCRTHRRHHEIQPHHLVERPSLGDALIQPSRNRFRSNPQMLRKGLLTHFAAFDASSNVLRCQQTQMFAEAKIDLLIGVRSEVLLAAMITLIDSE